MIGKKLWNLSRCRQVICVTHLPQIVAFADAHFRVQKETCGGRTLAILENLEGESRIEEMAIMIAGQRFTENAVSNARGVVQQAEAWKHADNS